MIFNEIFRAGTHVSADGTEVTITEDDLRKTAAVYNASLHEAPIVIGHPVSNGPAYGWVEQLDVKDGILLASAKDVDDGLKDLVVNGKYRKISSSFYLPNSPVNPKAGTWYLRHVGLLGAQAPAVKGLKDARFEEAGDYVYFGEDENIMTDMPVDVIADPVDATEDTIVTNLQEVDVMNDSIQADTTVEATIVESSPTPDVSVDYTEIDRMKAELNAEKLRLRIDRINFELMRRVDKGMMKADSAALAKSFLEGLIDGSLSFNESSVEDKFYGFIDTLGSVKAKAAVSLSEHSAPVLSVSLTPTQKAQKIAQIAKEKNVPLYVAMKQLED